MQYVLYAVGGSMLLWWLWRLIFGKAPRGTSKIFLLLHDGGSFVLHSARRDEAGNLVTPGGITYPTGIESRCVPAEDEASLGAPLYIIAADPLALATHRTLEVARKHIVVGNIFKSGGELMEMLRLAGQVLILVGALYAIMTVNGLRSDLARFEANQQKVVDVMSKPLVVAPAASVVPTVTPLASPKK